MNFLVSSVFLNAKGGHMRRLVEATGSKVSYLMDSGAFTNFANKRKALAKGERYEDEITLSQYIELCKRIEGSIWEYIAFDEIGNMKGTLANLERMVDAGLKPMPVLIIGEEPEKVSDFMQINKRICVAGGVTGTHKWIIKRMKDAYRHSDKKAKLHCLGYSRYPDVFKIPEMKSGDSTSYTNGAQYGWLVIYKRDGGFLRCPWKELDNTTITRQRIMGSMLSHGITYEQIQDPNNYRTHLSFLNILTVSAFMDYSMHCYNYGHLFFPAITSPFWFFVYMGIIHGYPNWQYSQVLEIYHELDGLYKSKKNNELYDRINVILKENTDWRKRRLWK